MGRRRAVEGLAAWLALSRIIASICARRSAGIDRIISVIMRRIAVSAIIRRRMTGSAIIRMCISVIPDAAGVAATAAWPMVA